MRVRDSYATLNGDKTETVMPSGGLEIIADDGRALYDIRLNNDGSLHVSVCMVCKHGGVVLDDKPLISLQAANCFNVIRPKYNG
jgi:hypothetical protein